MSPAGDRAIVERRRYVEQTPLARERDAQPRICYRYGERLREKAGRRVGLPVTGRVTRYSADATYGLLRDTARMPVYEAFRGTRLLGRLFYAMHGEEGAPNDADVIDFFDRFDVRGRMEIERLWAEKGEIEATFDLRTEQADP